MNNTHLGSNKAKDWNRRIKDGCETDAQKHAGLCSLQACVAGEHVDGVSKTPGPGKRSMAGLIP